ncbi:hypothetical protein [Desulfovibrio sp. ZJ200]|nr:hypothetical protein [Desulfovibrio sp. ZJ200]
MTLSNRHSGDAASACDLRLRDCLPGAGTMPGTRLAVTAAL